MQSSKQAINLSMPRPQNYPQNEWISYYKLFMKLDWVVAQNSLRCVHMRDDGIFRQFSRLVLWNHLPARHILFRQLCTKFSKLVPLISLRHIYMRHSELFMQFSTHGPRKCLPNYYMLLSFKRCMEINTCTAKYHTLCISVTTQDLPEF